jgi:predicted RNA-binding Zn ribbon-like protein
MADAFDKLWPGIGIGGSLALDYANVLDWRLRTQPVEGFRSFPDLLRWGWSAGVLERAEARALREWGVGHPVLAARALARAIDVREAIAEVCRAVIQEETLPARALGRLDAACRTAGAARELQPVGGGAAWAWRRDAHSEDRVAWAAALDAARLLTTPDRAWIRQCGDFECGWFFLDTSRNRNRRWCNMKTCGNRNKARDFYRRSAQKTP